MNVMDVMNTKSPLLPDLFIPGDDQAKLDEEHAKLLLSLKDVTRLDSPAFLRESQYFYEGDGTTHKVLAPFVTPYQLLPEVQRALTELARSDCHLCKGTGISRWRLRGRSANTCKCTRRHG